MYEMTFRQWIDRRIHRFKQFSIRFRICGMIRGGRHALMYGLVVVRMILRDICNDDIIDRDDLYILIGAVISTLNHITHGHRSIESNGEYLKRFKLIDKIYHGSLSYVFNGFILRFHSLLRQIEDENCEYDKNYLKDLCACFIDEINWIFVYNGGNLHD